MGLSAKVAFVTGGASCVGLVTARGLLLRGVRAAIGVVDALAPSKVLRGAGHILNTASVMGLFAKPMHAAYVATKFAVVGYSESLRMELAPTGVSVSMLCAGIVRTPLRENSQ